MDFWAGLEAQGLVSIASQSADMSKRDDGVQSRSINLELVVPNSSTPVQTTAHMRIQKGKVVLFHSGERRGHHITVLDEGIRKQIHAQINQGDILRSLQEDGSAQTITSIEFA